MTKTRTIVAKVIEQDLLGPDVLLARDEPKAPEGYELVRRLGQGGCGEVYLARDTRLERSVAIKFLNDVSAADIERFRREARFTARLNDPAIVQVYELGEADGRPFIVMQFIDGDNFADARLDLAGVVRVLRAVSLALKKTHAEGIVHRDIKPENILLDREGRAYLTDFGIARSLRGSLGETISRQGQVMGTPGLMPPEQARGDIQAVDGRSDIYSLGASLYFKLTEHYPFEATSIVDVLHAVIHDEPPLLRSRISSVPRSIEAIVTKCMQKSRTDRYQRIEEVVDEFDRFLSGAQIESESSAWFRRLVGQLQAAPAPVPADDSLADPYWAAGLEIVREISAWDTDLYRVSGSLDRSFSKLESVRKRLEEILTVRPDIAWARFYRGVVLFRCGRLSEAAEEMERAIDRVGNLAGANFELGRLYLALYFKEHRLARTHVTRQGIEDGLQSARGRLDQAVVAFQEAQRLGGDLPPWLADCTRAVRCLQEKDYQGCVKICDRIIGEEPDVEGVWKLRGDALRLEGKDPFASYDRALEVRRSYFEALYAKADAHLARGDLDAAREALTRAREIHPAFVDATALLARTYLIEARLNDDDRPLAEALRLAEEGLSLDGQSYDAVVTLAEIKLEKGRRCGGDEWLASTVKLLSAARTLDGCRNRVNLLSAEVNLQHARLARSQGRDPRPMLDAVLAMCRGEAARVADNEPWTVLRAEADSERARLDAQRAR